MVSLFPGSPPPSVNPHLPLQSALLFFYCLHISSPNKGVSKGSVLCSHIQHSLLATSSKCTFTTTFVPLKIPRSLSEPARFLSCAPDPDVHLPTGHGHLMIYSKLGLNLSQKNPSDSLLHKLLLPPQPLSWFMAPADQKPGG